jgi:site-specific DNA-methyltransferase (adenine-specific)/modification methylase
MTQTMTPTWQSPDGSVQLYLGDCLPLLAEMEPGSVDAVVSDVPYGIGFQHSGAASRNWRGRRCAERARRQHAKIIGDDHIFDPTPVLNWPCLLWGADHFANTLPSTGSWLCWDKSDMIGPADSFADAEFAWCSLLSIKRNIFRYLWKGLCCVKLGENNGFRQHPSQKPLALMVWCLEMFPRARAVLDPYMGSGTTGVACVRTGRKFIGIEIEPKYFAIAIKRIEAELNRFPLLEENNLSHPHQLELVGTNP